MMFCYIALFLIALSLKYIMYKHILPMMLYYIVSDDILL